LGARAAPAPRLGRADDLAEARRRQSAIEPKLSRLAIRVTQGVPGLVVLRDGSEIGRGAWGEGIPVDPGTHAVMAHATGHDDWNGSATVTEAGKTVTIEVPELAPTAIVAPPPRPVSSDVSPAPAQPPYWTGRRIASASIAGLGVAGLVVSGVLVGVAKADDDAARNELGTARHTDSQNAANLGDTATVIAGIGAALAIGGAVFWLTAPNDSVRVGSSGSSVLVRGSF
jgi:hypothetical protein